jgi:large subunit ribosomal protein L21
MYAIIDDSGTQFRVTTGDQIRIDRPLEEHPRHLEAGTITFDRVLLIGGEGEPKIGQPLVAGATVTAVVGGSVRAKKVIIEKHNRRKRYHRKQGHRQNYLLVRIESIQA